MTARFSDNLKNPFLRTFLDLVELTESPRIFYIWSALTGVSACLQRQAYLPFGPSTIYPNLFVLLVGPPGVRKSTAINITKMCLSSVTQLKFAPDDTHGQRQGLIREMAGLGLYDDEKDAIELALKNANSVDIMEDLNHINMDVDPVNKETMFIAASEFATIMGQNSLDMVTFLTKMYDGEYYKYSLKNSEIVLENPLINILAGSTPQNLSDILPKSAVGQGFTSRIVFVFGNYKHCLIPWPEDLNVNLQKQIEHTYKYIADSIHGAFDLTAEAKTFLGKEYSRPANLNDPRFIHYCERRFTHLLKLCISLAAARRAKTITIEDAKDALLILKETELGMPDALGEFGLSPVAAAKQKMIEYLQHTTTPVSVGLLWAIMQRDLKHIDFLNAIADLVNAQKLKEFTDPVNGRMVVYRSPHAEHLNAAFDALIGEEPDDEEIYVN